MVARAISGNRDWSVNFSSLKPEEYPCKIYVFVCCVSTPLCRLIPIKSSNSSPASQSFSFSGYSRGAWTVLLADLAEAANANPARLGVALTSISAAGITSLIFGGRLTDVLTRRTILVLSLVGSAMFFAMLSAVSTYTQLLAAFIFGGLVISFFDLIANAIGGDFEQQHGKARLTFFHAGWSFGAALGALASGVALTVEINYPALFVGLAGLLIFAGLLGIIAPLPKQVREREAPAQTSGRVLGVRGVLLAALLVVSTFSIDAGLEGYISLYLRNLIGSGALLGGVSISLLYSAAVIGRLVSGAAIERFGERRVILTSGVLTLFALLLVTLFTSTLPVSTGLFVIGLALSPLAPIAYSQAARAIPGRGGQAASAVTVFGYSAFLITPLIIGGAAELTSLRIAFTLLFLAGLGIIGVARATRSG